jgi:hypothetical protein
MSEPITSIISDRISDDGDSKSLSLSSLLRDQIALANKTAKETLELMVVKLIQRHINLYGFYLSKEECYFILVRVDRNGEHTKVPCYKYAYMKNVNHFQDDWRRCLDIGDIKILITRDKFSK